jgi:hypothetical protein
VVFSYSDKEKVYNSKEQNRYHGYNEKTMQYSGTHEQKGGSDTRGEVGNGSSVSLKR